MSQVQDYSFSLHPGVWMSEIPIELVCRYFFQSPESLLSSQKPLSLWVVSPLFSPRLLPPFSPRVSLLFLPPFSPRVSPSILSVVVVRLKCFPLLLRLFSFLKLGHLS